MSDDVFPVSELEAPSGPAGARAAVERALPFLWTAVAVLLMTAVTAAVLGWADEASAAERVAAAGAVATAQDFAFEASFKVDDNAQTDGFTFGGGVDSDTGRARLSGSMGPAGGTIEILTDGTIQYFKLPPGMTIGGPPWIRFDVSDLGVPMTSVGSPTANPLDTLRQLDAVVGDITRVGEDEVRGEETVHYRFVVDATKTNPEAAAKVPAELRDSLRRIPMELWLDDEDRPRRLVQVVDLGAGNGKMTSTVELFDFGKAVTVELPPEDQVRDIDLTDPSGLGSLFAPAPAPAN